MFLFRVSGNLIRGLIWCCNCLAPRSSPLRRAALRHPAPPGDARPGRGGDLDAADNQTPELPTQGSREQGSKKGVAFSRASLNVKIFSCSCFYKIFSHSSLYRSLKILCQDWTKISPFKNSDKSLTYNWHWQCLIILMWRRQNLILILGTGELFPASLWQRHHHCDYIWLEFVASPLW